MTRLRYIIYIAVRFDFLRNTDSNILVLLEECRVDDDLEICISSEYITDDVGTVVLLQRNVSDLMLYRNIHAKVKRSLNFNEVVFVHHKHIVHCEPCVAAVICYKLFNIAGYISCKTLCLESHSCSILYLTDSLDCVE